MARPERPSPTAMLGRLVSLTDDAQADYAAELLATTVPTLVIQEAANVLAANPRADARPALIRWYWTIDERGDDGEALARTALLRALRPIADPADLPIAERAVVTYQYPPPDKVESGGSIRATGLRLLDDLAPERAAIVAVRLLLHDVPPNPGGMPPRMARDPAFTAIEILANREQFLPIYGYALMADDDPEKAEWLAEALKQLTSLPWIYLQPVFDRVRTSTNDLALLGLIDLVLAHPEGESQVAWLRGLLTNTRSLDLYRYGTTCLAISRVDRWIDVLAEIAVAESITAKRQILREVLPLGARHPAVAAALDRLTT